MSNQYAGQMQQMYGCSREHAPEDVVIHLKTRLQELRALIPDTQAKLVEMNLELEMLERMLAAATT
jgi:hypothetical protein